MNRERLTPGKAVDWFLESLAEPGASRGDVDQSADRLLRHLEREYERLPAQRLPVWEGDRRRPWWRWAAFAAVSVVLAAGLMLLRVDTGAIASVEAGTITAVEKGNPRPVLQGGTLSANQSLRVGDAPARVSFADGSRVELRAKSEFSVVRVSDGIELRLGKGNVIVTAAKQKSGHLYVRTPDCTVSVTGTVFSVRAEETGSRISVFEGQVRVVQRDMKYTLSRGEQLATSPVLGVNGLEAEVQWSRNATAVLALLQAPAQSSSVPAGAESIEGLVMNTATGGPLAGVTVLVAAPGSPRVLFEVKSGNDGRFRVERVPPGSYQFVAAHDGFWDESSSPEVKIASGQSVHGVRLRMSQVATLSGRVVGENGQPVRSEALSLRILRSGDRVLREASTGARGGVTNDRGEYEFTDVLPGKYYIRIAPRLSPEAPVYYPGTLDVENAVAVDLYPGAVLTGINFTLPAVKLHSIRFQAPKDSLQWYERIYGKPGPTKGLMAAGSYSRAGATFTTPLIEQASASKIIVSTPPGFTLQSVGTLIDDVDRNILFPGPSRLTSLGNEEYVLNRAPPGKYHLNLRWSSGGPFDQAGDFGSKQIWASVDVLVEVVDKDVNLGKLASRPGNLSIPVRFTYADGVQSEVAIVATSTRQFGGRGLLNSLAPTLRLNNLFEESYSVQFMLAKPDRYVSLARYGTQDLLSGSLEVDGGDHGALEVVVDGPAGSVEGFVRDAKGDAISNVEVVLVPPPYRRTNRFLFRTSRTDQDGKFEFSGLAPDDYGVYSWESAPAQAYFDPSWLRDYETRGTRVTVRKGQTVNASVRLISPAR